MINGRRPASRRGRSRPGSAAPARAATDRRRPAAALARLAAPARCLADQPAHEPPDLPDDPLMSSTSGWSTCLRLKASSCRVSRLARCAARLISSRSSRAEVGGVERGRHQLGVAGDDGQQVVEVVRDAAGEPPDGLHLHRLRELSCFEPLLRASVLSGDVHGAARRARPAVRRSVAHATMSRSQTMRPSAAIMRYSSSWILPGRDALRHRGAHRSTSSGWVWRTQKSGSSSQVRRGYPRIRSASSLKILLFLLPPPFRHLCFDLPDPPHPFLFLATNRRNRRTPPPRRHGRGLPRRRPEARAAGRAEVPAARRRPRSARLAQFHDEVRIARQVSHPNVCRVYDIGEADGRTFLSMEYVDGEDLASLLRRIGRFPQDKAPRDRAADLRRASPRRTSAACCTATSSRPT